MLDSFGGKTAINGTRKAREGVVYGYGLLLCTTQLIRTVKSIFFVIPMVFGLIYHCFKLISIQGSNHLGYNII